MTPKSVKLIPDFQHDKHALFWSIAQLGWPEMRQKHLGTPMNSSINHVQIPPDEHLFCIDYLYYMAVFQVIVYPPRLSIPFSDRLGPIRHGNGNMTTVHNGGTLGSTCTGRLH